MPAFETSAGWAFTSTGTGKAVRAGMAQSLTFDIETSSGCTAAIQILTRQGSSAGAYGVLSTITNDTGALNVAQFLGPLKWVKPRVTDKTAGSTNIVTVRLTGV
jgi:hypothetical protein